MDDRASKSNLKLIRFLISLLNHNPAALQSISTATKGLFSALTNSTFDTWSTFSFFQLDEQLQCKCFYSGALLPSLHTGEVAPAILWPVVLKEQRFKQARTLQGSYKLSHSLSHTHSHTHTLALSGFLLGRAIHSLRSSQCNEMGDSGCSVEELAPLQRLSRTFHWETAGSQAGWLLVNKLNNKQQHRLYVIPTEREKKNPFWKRINPCHIIPVISDNSASICKHKKRKKQAWLYCKWLCWFYYSVWDHFTSINAYFFTVPKPKRKGIVMNIMPVW